MSRFRKTWLLATILAGIVLMGLAPSADAAFRLRVEDVGSGLGVVISDTDGDGVIVFTGPITGTGFVINITSGISQPPAPGGAGFAQLNLSSINVNASGPGTLRVALESDGFTGGAPGPLQMDSTVAVSALTVPVVSITAQTWANGANLVPAYGKDVAPPGGLLDPLGPTPPGSVPGFTPPGVTFTTPGGFATSSVGFTAGPAYSLFSQATVTFSAAGTVGFTIQQLVVPAPAGLVLAIAGLPVFGVAYLRRRLKKQPLAV
jgi:hypothetical protein